MKRVDIVGLFLIAALVFAGVCAFSFYEGVQYALKNTMSVQDEKALIEGICRGIIEAAKEAERHEKSTPASPPAE
jgi:hypothetical protein